MRTRSKLLVLIAGLVTAPPLLAQTETATPAFTPTPRPTRTATPPLPVTGDCDHDRETAIFELQTCVNVFLGEAAPEACPACDFDGDDEIDIVELQRSVNCFLDPEAVSCLYLGSGPAVCGDSEVQAPETCDDGNLDSGDGCAPNCTGEFDFVLEYGTAATSQSQALVQTASFVLALPITGLQVVTRGQGRSDEVFGVGGVSLFLPDEVPLATVVEANTGLLDPIAVPGLACGCIRFLEARTCGGLPRLPGAAAPLDCTADAEVCGAEECRATFGPGVAGAGRASCDGLAGVDYLYATDRQGGIHYDASGFAAPAVLHLAYTAIGAIFGNCLPDLSDPNKGPDGLPCTEDDAAEARGTPLLTVQTTGTAAGRMINANGTGQNIEEGAFCGMSACQTTAVGTSPSCEALLAGDLDGLCFASTYAALDQLDAGDVVVSARFCVLN